MSRELIEERQDFLKENSNEVVKRFSGFGKDLYAQIEAQLPDIFSKLTYYRRISCQTDDSYALYEHPTQSFAIQLEPKGEVIVLWNATKFIEIGFWSQNPCEDAISYIKKELLNK